jgi:mono/diheme cytochrome c family protein
MAWLSYAFTPMVALMTTAALAQGQSGAVLYDQKGCAACHGSAGQGGSAGPRLAPDPKPLSTFMSQLRTPFADMPPYGPKVLSDTEAQQIHAYLSTIKSGRPAASIDLLRERKAVPAR